jgi:hypothetical protein
MPSTTRDVRSLWIHRLKTLNQACEVEFMKPSAKSRRSAWKIAAWRHTEERRKRSGYARRSRQGVK